MSMYGGCDCKNIEIVWHIADQELVPRACQCEYCRVGRQPTCRNPTRVLRLQFATVRCIGKYSMAQILQFFTSALIARKWFLLQLK